MRINRVVINLVERILLALCYGFSPIAVWSIRRVNKRHESRAKPAIEVAAFLTGYFGHDLMSETKVVYVQNISETSRLGWMFKNAVGIALEDTYYIKEEYKHRWHLHFHELVHIRQWRQFGPHLFFSKYVARTLLHGYRNNPFELEAYELDQRFKKEGVFWLVRPSHDC